MTGYSSSSRYPLSRKIEFFRDFSSRFRDAPATLPACWTELRKTAGRSATCEKPSAARTWSGRGFASSKRIGRPVRPNSTPSRSTFRGRFGFSKSAFGARPGPERPPNRSPRKNGAIFFAPSECTAVPDRCRKKASVRASSPSTGRLRATKSPDIPTWKRLRKIGGAGSSESERFARKWNRNGRKRGFGAYGSERNRYVPRTLFPRFHSCPGSGTKLR